jgi:hypothetical protein
MLSDADIAHFRTFGFVVLRRAFDASSLSEELDRALREAFPRSVGVAVGGGEIAFRYVPMMCEHTPLSVVLLDRFAGPAAQLLGVPVLPVRAKGVMYSGATRWHSDSSHDLASIGFAGYLEPLHAHNGALRVVPGSHRPELGRTVTDYCARHLAGSPAEAPEVSVTKLPGFAIPTEPGDVIAFDEHLFHASIGGRNRRQWRVDYVADPQDVEEERKVRAYFHGTYPPGWDGGYDVDRYPTYGEHWLASGKPWIERLARLGVYELAAAEEAFARSRRSS